MPILDDDDDMIASQPPGILGPQHLLTGCRAACRRNRAMSWTARRRAPCARRYARRARRAGHIKWFSSSGKQAQACGFLTDARYWASRPTAPSAAVPPLSAAARSSAGRASARSHHAVAGRAVDGDAGLHQLRAQRVDVVDLVGEMAEVARLAVVLGAPVIGEFDRRGGAAVRPFQITTRLHRGDCEPSAE
jgi:hypothetical protein